MRQSVVALSAVATGCFTDDAPRLEHHHRRTPPGKGERRRQSGQAATDNHRIHTPVNRHLNTNRKPGAVSSQ